MSQGRKRMRGTVVVVCCAVWLVIAAGIVSAQSDTSDEQFGRFTVATDLVADPRGAVTGEGKQGTEFEVIDGPLTTQVDTWYEVRTLGAEDRGWVEAGDIELAEAGSTATLRRYEGGWCISSPIDADTHFTEVDMLDEYKYRLTFDQTETVIDESITDGYLFFDGSEYNSTVRLRSDDNAVWLTLGWVARHSSTWPLDRPRWDELGYWQLQLQCADAD